MKMYFPLIHKSHTSNCLTKETHKFHFQSFDRVCLIPSVSQICHCAVIPIISSLADLGWHTSGVGGEKVSKRENLTEGGAGHALVVVHTQNTPKFSFNAVFCIQHDSLASLQAGQCVKLD